MSVELSLPDKPQFIRGDRQRLEQLFDNLLQNSVRYTDPGGTLKIALQAKDGSILISWEDSSPGITDEQLPHLFDATVSCRDITQPGNGGSGPGSGHRETNRGCSRRTYQCFAIHTWRPVVEYPVSAPAGEKRMMIAIVEDEPKLARLLQGYLAKADFNSTIYGNGEEALEAIRHSPPDLVLLDLMLPGLDGMSVCRELRKSSDLPIIMLTARVEEIDRLLGLEIGADDYICKPYSPREVVARVKAVLRRSQPKNEGTLPE